MWLFSRNIDLFGLYIPVWLTWLLAFILPTTYLDQSLPIWMWLAFVLLFDVAHVWSTIFKTYLDPEARKNHSFNLTFVPIGVFVACFMVLSFGEMIFWRCMAYLALYHFIKQQYGFLMLYKWKSREKNNFKWDKFIIYWATIYPVIYWHLSGDRAFNWFVDQDFLVQKDLIANGLFSIGHCIYWLVIGIWFYLQRESINVPKIMWVITTALNWYIGIVYFNSDIVFTVTNVVAHGLPYMVLISFYKSRKQILLDVDEVKSQKSKVESDKLEETDISFKECHPELVEGSLLSYRGRRSWIIALTIVVFVSTIFALTEEYFWDTLVNHSKAEAFSWLPYHQFTFDDELISLFIALLSVPQLTHYILDGVIWKNNDKNPYLKHIFRSNLESEI